MGPSGGDYSGKDEVQGLFTKMMEGYGGSLALDVVDILANDHHGVVLTQESGTSGGDSMAWSGVHLWTLRNGRLAEFVAYTGAEYQRFWISKSRDT